ncbi:MAG: OB-fold protein [Nanoarchaeota archaeon]
MPNKKKSDDQDSSSTNAAFNEYSGVQCMFADEEPLLDLKKGDLITVKGRVDGYIMNSIIVRNCEMVK